MDIEEVNHLDNGDITQIQHLVQKFLQKNLQCFCFPGMTTKTRQRLGQVLATKLRDPALSAVRISLLELLRIMARDQTGLEELINDDLMEILCDEARLRKEFRCTFPTNELPVTTEAQKVLCNLIFHSKSAQRFFSREDIVDALISRISANKDTAKWPLENQLLDMKLLFILTILCADIRGFLRTERHATEDLCIYCTSLAENPDREMEMNIVNEILKVLFNLVHNLSVSNITMSEEMDLVILGQLSRELLIIAVPEETKKHVINLLTAVKKYGYNQLAISISDSTPAKVPFKGFEMEAIDVILRFLDSKIPNSSPFIPDESLAPVLVALTEASNAISIIRKYLKSIILPPLRDVHTRPEVGDSLRNKLVRLLTATRTTVRDAAGNFLFILCRKDAQRLIKYTGYGNAAGWLADRGLMGLPRSDGTEIEEEEDSETEEFRTFKSQIDPVSGAVRVERPDPMAGMTDEQKEQISMDLVNALDKMMKQGDFKPAAIDKHGKPYVVEHMEQFREAMEKNNPTDSKKDSEDEE